MINLIDNRYFTGLIELPYSQVSADYNTPSGDAASHEFDRLNIAIAKYQKKLLIELFGSEIVPDEVAELLVNKSTLTSPIANYVYCFLVPELQSKTTIQGEQTMTATGAQKVGYKNKMDEAWNDMIEMLGEIRKTLDDAGLDKEYPTDYNSYIYKLSYFI